MGIGHSTISYLKSEYLGVNLATEDIPTAVEYYVNITDLHPLKEHTCLPFSWKVFYMVLSIY